MDHIYPYIEENKIDPNFLSMMGEIGQVQFHQRFTVRMLQLIRVLKFFFKQNYKKELWRDAFSSDPDKKYSQGFNKYRSFTAQDVKKALERERKYSQISDFIEGYVKGNKAENLAAEHFRFLWEDFPDLIKPHLPAEGNPEAHIENFLKIEEIKDIPEFHILSNILFPLFDAYGIEDIENGNKDDILMAATSMSSYLPYCHFYATSSDIAELIIMSGINDVYNVKLYDNNESSLYKLIDDLSEAIIIKQSVVEKSKSKSIYRKTGPQKF